MWILTKCETGEKVILLPEKKKYTVGRAGTDIVLNNDPCISRSHAIIHLWRDSLRVQDVGSKYGTFCNAGIAANEKIVKNELTSLENGDQVRFGLLKNTWQVAHYKFSTLASALTRAQNQELTEHIKRLGGELLETWDSTCTHLTMNEVTVTIKLLYALLDQIPIVNCKFWKHFLELAECGVFNGEALPHPINYSPDRLDSMDLSARPERKTLFNGKTFVFMSRKHFDMYGPIVKNAGGTCKNLNNGVMKTFLTRPDVIVVQFVPSTQSQATETINNISDILESKALRLVPETEISLAITNCSIAKYCNPKYKIINDIISSEPATNEGAGTMFVDNSGGVESGSANYAVSEVFVPETDRAPSKTNCKPELPLEIDSSDDETEKESKMPSMSGTESNTKAETNSPMRRNRSSAKRHAIFDSDEDNADDGLSRFCQNNKKPHLEVDVDSEQPRITRRSTRTQKTSAAPDQTTLKSTDAKANKELRKEKKNETLASKVKSKSKPTKLIEVDSSDDESKKSMRKEITVRSEHSSGKRRHHFESSDEDDNNLKEQVLQFNKKPHLEENIAELEQSTSSGRSQRTARGEQIMAMNKAVSLVNQSQSETKSSKKVMSETNKSRLQSLDVVNVKRISLKGFLEKSQAVVTRESMEKKTECQSITQEVTSTRKRAIIQVLGDSDGDDNADLFNFGDAVPTKNKSRIIADSADESEDDLFRFNSRKDNSSNVAKVVGAEDDDDDLIETEPFEPRNVARKTGYVMLKPKELPRTVSTIGWLSCIKQEIKSEEGLQKLEESLMQKEQDPDGASGSGSFNSCVVHMKNCMIKRPNLDETDRSTNNTKNMSSGLKNFKKFTKQRMVNKG